MEQAADVATTVSAAAPALVARDGPAPTLRITPAADPHASAPYYPWFDWLRILLALVVALHHEEVTRWPNAGNLAVQVFFALSGWLIGAILLETEPRELPRFYFNRATRIWIPYAVALGLLLGTSVLRDPITWKYLEFVFYKLTFTYNIFGAAQLDQLAQMPLRGTGNHFWSICAEEQFYLLAPLLLVLTPRRFGRSPLVWAGVAGLALWLNAYAAISFGVLAAILRQRWGPFHASWPARIILVLVAVGGAMAMATEVVRYELAAPAFALAVVLLLAREGRKVPLGAFLGGVSYPFYLSHWLGIFGVNALASPLGMRGSALTKVLALLTSLAICSALYVLVDRQVLLRRNGWYTPRLGTTLAIIGFALALAGLVGGTIMVHR